MNSLLLMLIFAAKQVTAALRSIHDAVKAGNVQTLEAMVKNGASINEHDTTKDHFTPLQWACHVGSLEVEYSLVLHTIIFAEECSCS